MVRFATLERSRWGVACESLASLGFDAIDLPLVWSEHRRSGALVFDEGTLDVAAMITAASDAGLSVVARVGPMCADDVRAHGIPEDVLWQRACQARTATQSAVMVPDPPGAFPLPSRASHAYRAHANAWVRAAVEALSSADRGRGCVRELVLDDGPFALLRDDAIAFDHHADAGPASRDGDALAKRERDTDVSFAESLVASARAAGFTDRRLTVAVRGAARLSPSARALGARYGLCTAAPASLAGTSAIANAVREARAISVADEARIDLWCGAPPHYPPTRGSHSIEAARVAFAAGARVVSVRIGCSGRGWTGALLDERALPRADAQKWKALLALADTLPSGESAHATAVSDEASVLSARAQSVLRPLPIGLLGLLGIDESALRDGDYAHEDPATALRREGFESEPAGAAVARVVRGENGSQSAVLISRCAVNAKVRPTRGAWRSEGAEVSELTLAPGALAVLEGAS